MNKDIKRSRNLNFGEKCILDEIKNLSKRAKGCTAKNDFFADVFGVDERTVRRIIKRLHEKNCIAIDGNKHNRAIYFVSHEAVKEKDNASVSNRTKRPIKKDNVSVKKDDVSVSSYIYNELERNINIERKKPEKNKTVNPELFVNNCVDEKEKKVAQKKEKESRPNSAQNGSITPDLENMPVWISEYFDNANRLRYEALCMMYRKSQNELVELFRHFWLKAVADGVKWNYKKDMFSHFSNWMKYNKNILDSPKNNKTFNNKNRSYANEISSEREQIVNAALDLL